MSAVVILRVRQRRIAGRDVAAPEREAEPPAAVLIRRLPPAPSALFVGIGTEAFFSNLTVRFEI